MSTRRVVNKRGQGARLRADIAAAAARLLSGVRSGDAVTLRAIAREAGIATPSIYPHFADREAVLDEVVSTTYAQLRSLCADAFDSADSGVDRVRAVAYAYIDFARRHPGEYRILFERSPANTSAAPRPYPTGMSAFHYLVDAIEQMVTEGTSASSDPGRDAQALWAALHGVVTVVSATPGFPWKPTETLVDRLLEVVAT